MREDLIMDLIKEYLTYLCEEEKDEDEEEDKKKSWKSRLKKIMKNTTTKQLAIAALGGATGFAISQTAKAHFRKR